MPDKINRQQFTKINVGAAIATVVWKLAKIDRRNTSRTKGKRNFMDMLIHLTIASQTSSKPNLD